MKAQVKISAVKPNPKNPRLIKDHKFKNLVQSIKDFPEMLEKRPIVVDDQMVVLGGNMRLKACIEAGLKEVWIDVANWTEEQKQEFCIAHFFFEANLRFKDDDIPEVRISSNELALKMTKEDPNHNITFL